jgi:hypothetical protein
VESGDTRPARERRYRQIVIEMVRDEGHERLERCSTPSAFVGTRHARIVSVSAAASLDVWCGHSK